MAKFNLTQSCRKWVLRELAKQLSFNHAVAHAHDFPVDATLDNQCLGFLIADSHSLPSLLAALETFR